MISPLSQTTKGSVIYKIYSVYFIELNFRMYFLQRKLTSYFVSDVYITLCS